MNTPCDNCKNLEARISELEQIVAEQAKAIQEQVQLIKELDNERRKGKRQAQPFSKGKSLLTKKKPGRRPSQGHFDYRREPEKITDRIKTPLPDCPDCGHSLEKRKAHRNWQTDLPVIEPQVTCFETESGWCPQCLERKRSLCVGQIVSSGGASSHGLGPKLKAVSAVLKHRYGLAYRKQTECFETLFGLKLTPGGLCQSGQSMSSRLEGVYEEIAELLTEAASVHCDETGWRVGTASSWLWVFGNAENTLYRIEPTRGHEVILDVLGKDFAGVLISDRAKAYDHKNLNMWLKQKCIAHLLRNLSDLEEKQQRGALRFAREVKSLLRAALKLKQQAGHLEKDVFAKRAKALERKLDKLLSKDRNFSNEANRKMAISLAKQRPHLLRFLYHEKVDATNNQAERDLRPAVLARKTGRCNKTEAGAKTHAVLSSIIETLRKRGCNPIQDLTALLLVKQPTLNLFSSS
jgi:transposase